MTSNQWVSRVFGDCAELVHDTVQPAEAKNMPYIGLEHIAENKLMLIECGTSNDVTSMKSRFKKGDILFGKLRPYFRKVIIAPFEGVCSTDIWVVRPKANIDRRFLFYWMASQEFVDESMRGSSGTKMPRAQWEFVSRIKRNIPTLIEQEAIGFILGALDEKIELNRRMNETLEAMAQAFFWSWFVDFGPVRAKAEGRDTGLPKHIADLFPARFVDSELGEIPKGWEVAAAGTVFDIAIGKTPPRKEHQWFSTDPQDIPWMSIKDLGQTGTFISEVSEYLTPEAVDRFRVRRIPDGTVVLSFKLTVGRSAITDGEMLSNEAIAHFLPRGETFLSPAYTYCYLRQFNYETLGSTSSIATAVNSDNIRAIPILIPPEKVHEAFLRMEWPSFLRIREHQRESQTLTAMRDTLLPKLISGEHRLEKWKNLRAYTYL